MTQNAPFVALMQNMSDEERENEEEGLNNAQMYFDILK